MGNIGGARPGAGRPKGRESKTTLVKRAVSEALNQRVMLHANELFNAQLALAVGAIKIFRIDEEGQGAKKKRVHVHVTDSDEIKAVLDEHDGGNGTLNGAYYYVADVLPDNRAIEGMLNRTFGKPPEHLKIEPVDPKEIAKETIDKLESDYGLTREQAKAIVIQEFGDVFDDGLLVDKTQPGEAFS